MILTLVRDSFHDDRVYILRDRTTPTFYMCEKPDKYGRPRILFSGPADALIDPEGKDYYSSCRTLMQCFPRLFPAVMKSKTVEILPLADGSGYVIREVLP